MEKSPLLIVDCYGFIFRAYHIHQDLTVDDHPIGAVYGFTSMILKLIREFNPKEMVVVLDGAKKNFRYELFPEYKANRPEMPSALKDQLVLIDQLFKAFNFNILKSEQFEADDLIATVAHQYMQKKRQVIVISSDKDMFQLMGKYVRIYDPMKMKFISKEDVFKRFGVNSAQVTYVQALIGDSTDNIPGVKGVGVKTAAKLITQFGNIDNLLANIDLIKNARHRKLIEASHSDLLISQKLVNLRTDLKLEDQDFSWQIHSRDEVLEFLRRFHFQSLYKRAESIFETSEYSCEVFRIDNTEILQEVVFLAQAEGYISIFLDKGDILYLFLSGKIYSIDLANFLEITVLLSMFRSYEVKKISSKIKGFLHKFGGDIKAFDDISLMDYALNSGKKNRGISSIIHDLDLKCNPIKESFEYLPFYHIIYSKLEQKLFYEKSCFLYDLELRLSYILYDMEITGILLDQDYLRKLSVDFSDILSKLEDEIFTISGERFNISSPKQLSDILFNTMKLPHNKISSKSKNFSTNVDVLEKLSADNYEIAKLLLRYRHISKLKNTYSDSLPKYLSPHDRKIHSHFIQDHTTTGRLTSSEPNLQNIPVKTPEGSMIRRAFIAPENHKILSCDYSQIELRILASVADVKLLKEAFIQGLDVHTATAAQLFSLSHSEVTKDFRYKAKTINFSIIYGIKSFTLAQRLNISPQEAESYMSNYFTNYPEIRDYMEYTTNFVQKYSYVMNYFGRKIYIPEINSSNFKLREFAKRAAINAPIQSCAADIIKIAMVAIFKDMVGYSSSTRLLIQIHDELVFQVKDSELEDLSLLVNSNMRKAFSLDVPIDVSLRAGENFLDLY